MSNEGYSFDYLYSQFTDRLDANFDDYKEFLGEMCGDTLVGMADVIAAMVNTYDYLKNDHSYDKETLLYLLQFANPLEIVSDVYRDYHNVDYSSEFRDIMYTVVEEQSALREGYEVAAPLEPPNDDKYAPYLPPICFVLSAGTGEVCRIFRNMDGLMPTSYAPPHGVDNAQIVDQLNAQLGVTPAQREAMHCGAANGKWDAPGADPRNYREDGMPKKPSEWIMRKQDQSNGKTCPEQVR